MTLVAALGTMGVVVGFWGIMGVVEVFWEGSGQTWTLMKGEVMMKRPEEQEEQIGEGLEEAA